MTRVKSVRLLNVESVKSKIKDNPIQYLNVLNQLYKND